MTGLRRTTREAPPDARVEAVLAGSDGTDGTDGSSGGTDGSGRSDGSGGSDGSGSGGSDGSDGSGSGGSAAERVEARVAAVVVNHDAGDALLGCVASVRAAGVRELVVVDNSSSDGSLERLAAVDVGVVVPTGRNLGYGRAANRGVARTRSELVLICNPDLVVGPGAVAALVDALDAAPDVAIAGPLLRNPDGSRYPSARSFPSLAVAAGHALGGLVAPGNRWSRRYKMADRLAELDRSGSLPSAPIAVDWVSGACVLVRRVAFDAIGGFDERYFMYAEDVDLCWRLGRASWGARYVPAAEVVHAQGLSTAKHPVRMIVAHHASAWRFARVSTSGPARFALPLTAGALALRLALALLAQLGARTGRSGSPSTG